MLPIDNGSSSSALTDGSLAMTHAALSLNNLKGIMQNKPVVMDPHHCHFYCFAYPDDPGRSLDACCRMIGRPEYTFTTVQQYLELIGNQANLIERNRRVWFLSCLVWLGPFGMDCYRYADHLFARMHDKLSKGSHHNNTCYLLLADTVTRIPIQLHLLMLDPLKGTIVFYGDLNSPCLSDTV